MSLLQSTESTETREMLDRLRRQRQAILEQVRGTIVGQDDVVHAVMLSLLVGGHSLTAHRSEILLDKVPAVKRRSYNCKNHNRQYIKQSASSFKEIGSFFRFLRLIPAARVSSRAETRCAPLKGKPSDGA